jgi:hypothetical protein
MMTVMSDETDPIDARDSALPSRDDIETILANLAFIQQNAQIASEYIESGDYEHPDLQQAIHAIKENARTLRVNPAKHMSATLGQAEFPELGETD